MAPKSRPPKSPLPTVGDVLRDVDVARLKGKLADLNERYKHLAARLRESDERLDAILGLKDKIGGQPPKNLHVKRQNKPRESTAVLLASDWHIEERVEAATVNGKNRFDPTIASKRVEKFFQNGLALIETCRKASRIDTLVLALLGDFITNTLHEDQAESNYLSPTEATLKAYRLLCGGIDFLLAHAGLKQLLIPCNYGNHGRNTRKPRVSTAAKNSYEWMMYHLLAERYSTDKRVSFRIADGYLLYLEVFNTTLRLHHGDGIKYQGGVGGVHIPLNKAIAQWNKMQPATLDLLGHWHSRMTGRDYVVNGSLIGFSPYAIAIKAAYEPPQQSFFLIHPERGKTLEAPVFVE